jgi:chromosomal replication initiator protein
MTYKELKIKYDKSQEIATLQEQYIAELKEIIKDRYVPKKRLTLPDIMDAVCNYYQVESKYIFGRKRNRPYVRPRQIVAYIAKYNIPNITYKDIGRYLGNRDHSTMINSVKSVNDELSYRIKFKKEINEIKAMLSL